MATQNPLAQYNEFTPQVQGLERQRKIAEMLMQQGMQAPQGQMVSGHYVAPSWTQNLAQLANAGLGVYGMNKAEEKQQALAQQYRQASQQELADFLRDKQGTQPTERVYASEAGPARDIIPGQAPMDKLALALKASQAQYNPMLPALGAKLLEQQFREPKWEKAELPQPDGSVKTGWVDVNSAQPELTFRSGGTKPAMSASEAARLGLEGQKFTYETGQAPNFGGFTVSSGTGPRTDPITGQKNQMHAGFDIKIPKDTQLSPLTTPEFNKDVGGKVLRVVPEAQSGGYGNMVEVQRQDGSVARYAHLSSINVKPGEQITQNTVYGNPGSTGKSTGVHVHYEVNRQTTPNSINLSGQVIQGASNPTQPGYQVASTGNVAPSTGMSPKQMGEANQAIYTDKMKRQQEYAEKLPGALEMMKSTTGVLNQMIGDTKVDEKGRIVYGKVKPHEGFRDVVGAWLPWSKVPESQAADFQSMLDQVKGQTFLQAFETLKGAGQITEIEGTKATQALNRMRESQSPAAFIKAAREFEENVNKGMAIAQQRAGMKPTGTSGGWSVINVTPGAKQ